MMAGMMEVSAPAPQDEAILSRYLEAHAMRALAPGQIAPPLSTGAALYQQTCSQCHALPDPTQHTVSEWPAVVARMRKNMEIMGKWPITDQEADEIVSYLATASSQN